MSSPADVIAEARKFVGLHEQPPGSNNQLFGAWYGLQNEPWCAIFVSYVLYQVFGFAPVPAQSTRGFAGCPEGEAWLKAHGQWTTVPAPGCLAFYDWDHDGVSDHVEIVADVVPGAYIDTIGGNTGPASVNDGGEVAEQHRDLSHVVGFGVIPYSAPAAVPAPATQPSTQEETMQVLDPKTGNTIVTNAAGEVFVLGPDGRPAATGYLGNLPSHPQWHAGGGQANGPVVAIMLNEHDMTGAVSGYILVTRDTAGAFHPYAFPSDGSLAK